MKSFTKSTKMEGQQSPSERLVFAVPESRVFASKLPKTPFIDRYQGQDRCDEFSPIWTAKWRSGASSIPFRVSAG
jgi:hypothetical protein